ncbi:MAG: dihydroorotate dehydrogenase [Chloroflexi bacterium 44-23]|nr:MAG: dihydroorotate dehydrogenase [Chloroflexi bacterium 44-23]
MTDLSTNYLGLNLKNPLVASASPLSKKVELAKALEDAGVAAIVMYSLFEEQITQESKSLDYYLTRGSESFAEALTYFPTWKKFNIGPENYLELISSMKSSLDIPIIGSLNGISSGGWVEYARKIEQAGADALELNIYYIPTDKRFTSVELESAQVELVTDIRSRVSIPLAVKLSPYYSALPNFAKRLEEAGANGLVLFNRFYQPEIDIRTLEVNAQLELSTSHDMLLPTRWVAILFDQIQCDLALTSGVHNEEDVLKAMMAGAKVVEIASELIANGAGRITEILAGMETWMDEYEYQSIRQMQGSMSHKSVAEPAAFERANYMKSLQTFDNRILYPKTLQGD